MKRTLLIIIAAVGSLFAYGLAQHQYNEATFHNHIGSYIVFFMAGNNFSVQLDYGMANPLTEQEKSFQEFAKDLHQFNESLDRRNSFSETHKDLKPPTPPQ
jgi:hypothetical protein